MHASILGFDGQLTVFVPYEGPCYRCLYPQPPPADLAPSCGANGVLGVLPGIMGLLQANETIKLIIGAGEPLVGRLLLFEALSTQFTELRVRRDAEGCPVCGDGVDLERHRVRGLRGALRGGRLAPAPQPTRLTAAMATVKIPPVLRPSVERHERGPGRRRAPSARCSTALAGRASGDRATSSSPARAS